MIVMICLLLTTGTYQPSAVDKTAPIVPNKDPNSTPYVPRGNQISISDLSGFLAKWNDKMHSGYSPQQIENYSLTLEDGILKKYKISPDYPTLNIPDMKPFCLEVGMRLAYRKISLKYSQPLRMMNCGETRSPVIRP